MMLLAWASHVSCMPQRSQVECVVRVVSNALSLSDPGRVHFLRDLKGLARSLDLLDAASSKVSFAALLMGP